MSRHAYCFLIILFLNTGAGNDRFPFQSTRQVPAGTAEVRGTWVARQVRDRETGRDSRLSLRMRLYDRQGRVRERALTLLGLQGGPGRPIEGDRSLIRFTYPNDIEGTGFLVWEHPDADDERFLFLPALGRVRRIAGAEAQESFVGSDFTYEDIGGREFDDYAYRMLDDRPASLTAPDGGAVPVYWLESRRRAADAKYPRVVSAVARETFVVVRAEIHNRRDEVQKVFEATRVARVGGYWTVMQMRMADALQRTRTELEVEAASYDVGLTPDAFTRRALERWR
jgi:Outer membrane lipoprotein-sorting protein